MHNELLCNLVKIGLDGIYNSATSYYNKKVAEPVGLELLNEPFMEPYFNTLFENDLPYWLERVSRTFLEELKKEDGIRPSEFWTEKFKSYSSTEYLEQNMSQYLNCNAPWIDLGVQLDNDLDIFAVFLIAHEYVSVNSWNWDNSKYKLLLNKLAEEKPVSLKIFADSKVFNKKNFGKQKPKVRALIYEAYIKAGLLTEKAARKIRSESSATASYAGLLALLDSKDSYDNYTDLLLCFTDSRHESVVCELATRLPLSLISSILGTEFEYAKTIVERRMMKGE